MANEELGVRAILGNLALLLKPLLLACCPILSLFINQQLVVCPCEKLFPVCIFHSLISVCVYLYMHVCLLVINTVTVMIACCRVKTVCVCVCVCGSWDKLGGQLSG